MHSFFKEETFGLRQQLTFIGNEMKIYLPKNYLEPNSVFAKEMGNSIETIGIFWFSVDNKFYELSMPLRIVFEFQERTTFKGKLKPELLSLDYDVFILKNGDAFCKDLLHKKDIKDIDSMLLRVIDQGKMPLTVSYTESLNIMLNLFESADVLNKVGVSSSVLEILLSEMYRNKHNVNEPFRKLLATSKTASLYDYKLVRMNRLSGLNSVFNAIYGENTVQQLTNAIIRTREKIPDRPTPMEKLMRY